MKIKFKSPRELRRFAWMTSLLVVAIFALVLPFLRGTHYPLWPWWVAAILSALALIAPKALGPLEFAMVKVGDALSFINSRIILSVMFYLVIFPVGLLYRTLKGDPLKRQFEPALQSYRVLRQDWNPTGESLKNPY